MAHRWQVARLLERALPLARQEVDAITAETAWAAGRELSLDEAVAYALEPPV
jgi:hypothetical protein